MEQNELPTENRSPFIKMHFSRLEHIQGLSFDLEREFRSLGASWEGTEFITLVVDQKGWVFSGSVLEIFWEHH